jgi:sugar fermentation stimulation protein A
VETGEDIITHVKNTGRSKELLLPDTLVAVNHQPSEKRKTAYDLIAVKKKEKCGSILIHKSRMH